MSNKKLSETEIGRRILALRPGGFFAVSTPTERGVASRLVRAFKISGRIEYAVKSREDEHGKFVFYIAPSTNGKT